LTSCGEALARKAGEEFGHKSGSSAGIGFERHDEWWKKNLKKAIDEFGQNELLMLVWDLGKLWRRVIGQHGIAIEPTSEK